MPRFSRVRPLTELRTLGDFLRDYKREESFSLSELVAEEPFAARADRRRTFNDFRTWLREQPLERLEREFRPVYDGSLNDILPGKVGPREVNLAFTRSRRSFDSAASAFATADPNQGPVYGPATGTRSQPDESVTGRRENTVARNLRIAANASAADRRRFQPDASERTIYGTTYQVRFHSRFSVVSFLRSRKRREVMFARGFLRRRGRSIR